MKQRRNHNPKRVLVYTGGGLGTALLEHLLRSGHTVVGLCSPPKPSIKQRWLRTYPSLAKYIGAFRGQYPPFTRLAPAHTAEPQVLAELHDIPWADPAWVFSAQAEHDVRELAPDIALVVDFPALIPEVLLRLPTCGTYGIFTGDYLGAYGPSPIERAIVAGKSELQLTLYPVLPVPGSGAPIDARRIPIDAPDTPESLNFKARKPILELCDQAIGTPGEVYASAAEAVPASRQPRFTPRDAVIDWNSPAESILSRISAAKDKWGGFAALNGTLFCIQDAAVCSLPHSMPPGSIFEASKQNLCIAASGSAIRILALLSRGGQVVSWQAARSRGVIAAGVGDCCAPVEKTAALLHALKNVYNKT